MNVVGCQTAELAVTTNPSDQNCLLVWEPSGETIELAFFGDGGLVGHHLATNSWQEIKIYRYSTRLDSLSPHIFERGGVYDGN